ncbi:MAG: hypothetical protein R2778_09345 [Saprospiraceae bacterium]
MYSRPIHSLYPGEPLALLGRHRFYLKNIGVVSLLSIKSVVFDKTGTITNIAQQSFQYHGKAQIMRQE